MAALGDIGVEVVQGDQHGFRRPLDTFAAKDISLYLPLKARAEPWQFLPGDRNADRYSLRGTIKNSAGAGIARVVVSFDEVTKIADDWTTSDSSGNFELRPQSKTNPHSVFHLPTDAHDGVIFSGLTPVPH